ncbi:hypothetical protein, partial [Mesorhizobium ciceri]|uniref:hypothetical protein n=1 Tax=Mesorhizobium ciceri TaxID=39645 RepID=UPI00344DAB7E
PLTRIANRIAKGNSGQSDLSPRGEEVSALTPVSSPCGGEAWSAQRAKSQLLGFSNNERPEGGGRKAAG